MPGWVQGQGHTGSETCLCGCMQAACRMCGAWVGGCRVLDADECSYAVWGCLRVYVCMRGGGQGRWDARETGCQGRCKDRAIQALATCIDGTGDVDGTPTHLPLTLDQPASIFLCRCASAV